MQNFNNPTRSLSRLLKPQTATKLIKVTKKSQKSKFFYFSGKGKFHSKIVIFLVLQNVLNYINGTGIPYDGHT